MKTLLALISIIAASQAIAAEPAYWMKEYPNAPQAKVDRCLAEAEDAYAKNLKGGMTGVAWATLHQGNAWEKCMDGK